MPCVYTMYDRMFEISPCCPQWTAMRVRIHLQIGSILNFLNSSLYKTLFLIPANILSFPLDVKYFFAVC
jgi:hypothetical protein